METAVPQVKTVASAGERAQHSCVAVVIPARLASVRLPRKVLASIAGRPLLWWTADAAARSCVGPANVYIATGDDAVHAAAEAHGLHVLRTPQELPSGTARVAAAAQQLPAHIDKIINVQADEPLLDPAAIDHVVSELAKDWELVTTVCAIKVREWRSPAVVKAVVDRCGEARWFTRAPVPQRLQNRSDEEVRGELDRLPEICRHLGVYGFKRSSLARWTEASGHAIAELAGLEQLDALCVGWRMGAVRVRRPRGPAVDTPADLEAVRALLQAGGR